MSATTTAVAQDGRGSPPAGIQVDWRAPGECPDRRELLRILSARMPSQRPVARLHARAQISRESGRYRLDLELESETARASRTLENLQCGPLVEATAVLIVLALESDARPASTLADEQPAASVRAADAAAESTEPLTASDAVEPTAAQRAETESRTASPPVAAGDTPTAPSATADLPEIRHEASLASRTPRELHLQLSAAIQADLGTFPRAPALGLQAQVAARIAPLYVALGASYWPAREQPSLSYPSARLRGSGLFFDLALGADISALPVLLTPALDLEIGQLQAEASGIAGPERRRAVWLAFGPRFAASVSVSGAWSLALDIAGLIPLYRTHWLVQTPQGDVPAFDAAPLVLRAALRIGYAFR